MQWPCSINAKIFCETTFVATLTVSNGSQSHQLPAHHEIVLQQGTENCLLNFAVLQICGIGYLAVVFTTHRFNDQSISMLRDISFKLDSEYISLHSY